MGRMLYATDETANIPQILRKGGENLQSKHMKSGSLKCKIIAPLLAAALIGTCVVPAVTSINTATAASAEDEVGAGNVYSAPVNSSNSANEGLYWANATYFDYLSDEEMGSSGWLNPIKAGTGFNGSQDEWYPYYRFNREVVKAVADSNSGWQKPLYFGNFCNTNGAYNTSGHHSGVSNGYTDATGSYNVTNFQYAPNNSNGLSNMYQSYQGLMSDHLDSNGNLLTPNGVKAPYFDRELLTGSKASYAKLVDSKFPFRVTETNGVTKYEFDSTNARDNVYFTWSGNTPTKVNYGANQAYGVLDGIKYFMNPNDTDPSTGQKYKSGYGIFPFNNRSVGSGQSTGTRYIYLSKENINWSNHYCYFFNSSGTVGNAWPGYQMTSYDSSNNVRVAIPAGATSIIFNNNSGAQTGNITDISKGAFWLESNLTVHTWDSQPADAGTSGGGTSENLDYGFGIKTEMNFRVPTGGRDKAGNDVTFEYSGDDDLWVYITDLETGSSQLVLDLGGNHKQAKGSINFRTLQATANDVYGKGTNQTKSFTFDYSKPYKMSIFYMERGMLESNCKMSFSMVPLGNEFTVTETINTTDINAGLKTAVAALDKFTFAPKAGTNGTTAVSNLNYIGDGVSTTMSGSTFDLGNGGAAHFNNVLTTGDKISVTQSQTSSSYLTYDRTWTYTDKVGDQATTNGTAASTGTKQLINSTTNPDRYEFASLQADFVNTPQSAPVTITKEVQGATGDTAEFGGTVQVQLSSTSGWQAYQLAYTASDGGSYTLSSSGKLATGGKLKQGRELTFTGIPQGAKVRFQEDTPSAGYSFVSVTGSTNGITVGATGAAITVTNKKLSGGGNLYVNKTLDGETYDGNQFSFKAEGVERSGYVKGANATANSVRNGRVTFNLSFTQPGQYIYKITEDNLSADLTNKGYHKDSATFYAKFTVAAGADGLAISGDPVYYSDAACTTQASAVFNNTTEHAKITVNKQDPAGDPIKDTVFAVVKVKDETPLSKEQINYLIQNDSAYFTTGNTKADGTVEFADLPVFQNGDWVFDNTAAVGAPNRWLEGDNYYNGVVTNQTYLVFEFSPTNGYNTNNTTKFVTFPYESNYSVTFDYTNVAVIDPASGGTGMQLFLIIGFGVFGTGLLMAAAYVLYDRRVRAARRARHGKRFK